jgi:hypothetical protein
MALLFILMGKGCNPGRVKGDFFFLDKDARQNMAMSVAFHGIVFWSIMLCGLVSANIEIISIFIIFLTNIKTLYRKTHKGCFI